MMFSPMIKYFLSLFEFFRSPARHNNNLEGYSGHITTGNHPKKPPPTLPLPPSLLIDLFATGEHDRSRPPLLQIRWIITEKSHKTRQIFHHGWSQSRLHQPPLPLVIFPVFPLSHVRRTTRNHYPTSEPVSRRTSTLESTTSHPKTRSSDDPIYFVHAVPVIDEATSIFVVTLMDYL